MKPKINNDYYNHLGESWYTADNDPIAILRAEQKTKNPWIEKKIKDHFPDSNETIKIVDVGCGAGFLTNYLAMSYKNVTGLDASQASLDVARNKNEAIKAHEAKYIVGDAYQLPFSNQSVDIVCAMDFLEHVENPQKVISECSRILKPGGIFFFHTFNRNFLSWLIVIKFMEWFVPNTPKNLHVLHLFIKPKELIKMQFNASLTQQECFGLSPRFNTAFLKSLFLRRVTPEFGFKINSSLALGYIGYSIKN